MDNQVKITLKAARVNAKLAQDDVAKKMYVIKQTIANWERGTTTIRYSDIVALSELYQIQWNCYHRYPLCKTASWFI